jgi:hypothetical protein
MTTWSQILIDGVTFPRSKPCKEDLLDWVNDHAALLDCLRDRVLFLSLSVDLSVRRRNEIESRIGKASIKGLGENLIEEKERSDDSTSCPNCRPW